MSAGAGAASNGSGSSSTNSNAPIKSATTPYGYFMSEQYRDHKDDFAGLAVGQAGAEISRRWQALDDTAKAKFRDLAAKDRERYEAECNARDAEVEARQAANREKWGSMDPASQSFLRERAPAEPKKERRVTKEEDMSEERLEARRLAKEKREKQKAARLAGEAESSRQKETIAAAAAATARKR